MKYKQKVYKKMGSPYIRVNIRRYFEEHPGINVWLTELREMLKTHNRRPTDGGIQGAVASLIDGGMAITVLERGQCWIYTPNSNQTKVVEETTEVKSTTKSPTEKQLFQLIHTTKQGAMILEDEDGELIVVKQVDI